MIPSRPFVLIVASAKNGAIGLNGGLPWHISSELKYFKARTTGHVLICGRTTWNTLPISIQSSDRAMLVITKNPNFITGAHTAASVPEAFEKAKTLRPEHVPLVIGGAQIYKLFMPYAGRIEVSLIDEIVQGDTFFPDLKDWTLKEEGPWNSGTPRWRTQIYEPKAI